MSKNLQKHDVFLCTLRNPPNKITNYMLNLSEKSFYFINKKAHQTDGLLSFIIVIFVSLIDLL